jgi:predicted ATPase
MIKSVDVTGLNGKLDHHLNFHSDLNLITGKNGAGKTTLLKLAWYVLSGNIERIPSEIEFKTARVEGDGFRVNLKRAKGKQSARSEGVIEIAAEGKAGKPVRKEIPLGEWDRRAAEVDLVNRLVAKSSGASFFFPTFRRIEGGFAVNTASPRRDIEPFDVSASLQRYVQKISVYDHRFITTISTDDVEFLLTRRLADASERSNDIHRKLTDAIIEKIKSHRRTTSSKAPVSARLKRSEGVLNAVHKQIEQTSARREQIMKPFSLLEEMFKRVFHHKGIRLSDVIVFGDASQAVRASQLSAGEKQLLSFLCYNAFTKNAVFFIDEPEISLHADWQRLLFGLLLEQGTGNQFIAATHSPFIYSKYAEKEHPLTLEKGE